LGDCRVIALSAHAYCWMINNRNSENDFCIDMWYFL